MNLPTVHEVRALLAAIRADVAALAALERWPAELAADIEDRLRRAPAVSLRKQAAYFARRLREERDRRGLIPPPPEMPAQSSALPRVVVGPTWLYWWRKRKRSGIAKALQPEGTPKRAKRGRKAFLEDFPEDRERYRQMVEKANDEKSKTPENDR